MSLDDVKRPMLLKEDLRFRTDDINLPRPRYFFNRVDYSLDVSDICGARKRFEVRRLGYSRRCVNPLEPVYQLASYKHEHPKPSRFTKDAMDISDIEGTKATVPIYLRMKTRDHINYSDIEGSTANHRIAKISRKREGAIPLMQVADINISSQFQTTRHTNPLSPRYDYDRARASQLSRFTPDGKKKPEKVADTNESTTNAMATAGDGDGDGKGDAFVFLGDVEGSHAKPIRGKALPMFSLQTQDIEGNSTMTRWKTKAKLKLPSSVSEAQGMIECLGVAMAMARIPSHGDDGDGDGDEGMVIPIETAMNTLMLISIRTL